MMPVTKITRPESPAFDGLCEFLAERAPQLDSPIAWPQEQLAICGDYGVYSWFLPAEFGGQAWSDADVVQGYLRLSAACLTTTFVITQFMGACRRIVHADLRAEQKRDILSQLVMGQQFATVGISHLTTSRRHLDKPVLRAEECEHGYRLTGYSPWITGATHAAYLVLGATLDDGRQILALVSADSEGTAVKPPVNMVGLSAGQTGAVEFQRVFVSRDWLLAGPVENVMKQGIGASSGGLQTSTLALGLASAALTFLEREGQRRSELRSPTAALREEWDALRVDLIDTAQGIRICPNEQLRQRANSLVLRATQAAMAAAKGAGYVIGHPAGRWCQEALFFLVWSCPQPVLTANLCEWAGILD